MPLVELSMAEKSIDMSGVTKKKKRRRKKKKVPEEEMKAEEVPE